MEEACVKKPQVQWDEWRAEMDKLKEWPAASNKTIQQRGSIMKKTIFAPFVTALIAALCLMPLSSAQSGNDKTTLQDVKQETQDLLRTLQGYTADQRNEAIRRTDRAVKKLDGRIEALETRIDNNWDQMDQASREKARAGMKALRRQRTELAEWYGGLKNSSVNAWEQMKKGFSDAYQTINDSWEKAERESQADSE